MPYSYLSMASKPGILTDWPWKPLGSFKYILLVPLITEHIYSFMEKDEDIDVSKLVLFPFMLWRMLHNQLWISLSRYLTAKGTNKIVDKGIEFDQVDRERDWDDQIMFNAILFYWGNKYVPGGSHLPFWRLDGVIITMLLHAGPVEFLYYWLHRALHHHYLYSRYHSHHHSSIVTEPITSVIHPFAEHIAYFLLFAIPILTTVLTGTVSIVALAAYITYLDFMNNMGHCNFELIPSWLFTLIPPLKYIIYTPSFHSLHHVQFRTNYSLFMPFYDYIYGTMDKSSDTLYEKSLRRKEESPHVVHLTHLTTPESIYHLRLGFASFASKPYTPSTWHMWLLWPVTLCSMMLTWIYCFTFVVESNRFHNIRLQTWTIPKYNIQTWLVGDGLSEVEQKKASKGTLFIPFSQFPPKKLRTDCFYHTTPAMQTPLAFENVDSCENWLPRRVMSVWRIAGLVHALEGWEEHECGYTTSNIEKVWEATVKHGFQPLRVPTHLKS
ncbi:hypothetical protein ES288_A05G371200v1 [Gossypium darwinii]|uniref:Fatty acid hydroxylase domain-containing protein n=1 Tax=Gossypium darwinii TaxID=34276 RepID=A0A5D2GP19_GOSDA|nr:hypothetical protein ES288_A05G371200v1 [Gossypium darwinii]